ncbi:flavin reductase family protein [Natrarchaeobius chitinivorans]|uniref:Flavin reductase family protein n=1 Tax=Natrarchaeobius chitinivorans TaxID=1679083 RepID=A0A3N6PD42_NATCH|nr:flavin reductase family protein [Natrarchaeobius chitinivorans]RQG94835.1 flavin reductase family protein [Natrarchaeobius chitinivorans]
MELARSEIDYRTVAGAVVPRPIAWTSSISPDGEENLAPFSFFNVATTTPPVLLLSVTKFDEEKPDLLKDTFVNIRETEEFVVNIVTHPLLETMNETSARLPHGVSEFEHADVERAESTVVSPPRVGNADVSFECTLHEIVPVGKSALILGDVVRAHIDDSITVDGKLDVKELDAVGRLSGGYYSPISEYEYHERPP